MCLFIGAFITPGLPLGLATYYLLQGKTVILTIEEPTVLILQMLFLFSIMFVVQKILLRAEKQMLKDNKTTMQWCSNE